MFKEHLDWVLNHLSSSLKLTRKKLGVYWKINTFSFLRLLVWHVLQSNPPTSKERGLVQPHPLTEPVMSCPDLSGVQLPYWLNTTWTVVLLCLSFIRCGACHHSLLTRLYSHYMLQHHTGFQRFYNSIPVSASPNYGQDLIQEASNSLIMYLGASPVLALKNNILWETSFRGNTRDAHVKSHPVFPPRVCSGAGTHSQLDPAPGSTHLTDDSPAKAPICRTFASAPGSVGELTHLPTQGLGLVRYQQGN